MRNKDDGERVFNAGKGFLLLQIKASGSKSGDDDELPMTIRADEKHI